LLKEDGMEASGKADATTPVPAWSSGSRTDALLALGLALRASYAGIVRERLPEPFIRLVEELDHWEREAMHTSLR
jgi:hypothetical protein